MMREETMGKIERVLGSEAGRRLGGTHKVSNLQAMKDHLEIYKKLPEKHAEKIRKLKELIANEGD